MILNELIYLNGPDGSHLYKDSKKISGKAKPRKKTPITKNALIGVGGPLQNPTKCTLKLPH